MATTNEVKSEVQRIELITSVGVSDKPVEVVDDDVPSKSETAAIMAAVMGDEAGAGVGDAASGPRAHQIETNYDRECMAAAAEAAAPDAADIELVSRGLVAGVGICVVIFCLYKLKSSRAAAAAVAEAAAEAL